MRSFMGKNFLLSNKWARDLYHNYVSKLPIIDYFCRIPAKDIAKNVGYSNITELWFSSENYKCRAMRSAGVEEKYILGNASAYEKFREYCRIMPSLMGNGSYILSHLELIRYFDCHLTINEKNCDEIWKLTAERLCAEDMRAKSLIQKSNCALICTADDPADPLDFHKQIKEDSSFSTIVLPTFCPDAGLNVSKVGFRAYVESLGRANGVEIEDLKSLVSAYELSIGRFDSHGCKIAFHSLGEYSRFVKPNEYQADMIFKKALASDGRDLTNEEIMLFKGEMLYLLGKLYKSRGWAMRLCLPREEKSINAKVGHREFESLIDYLVSNEAMPKTVIEPAVFTDSVAVSFIADSLRKANSIAPVVINAGVWGLNDDVSAVGRNLADISNMEAIGRQIGVFTDSESIVSFSGHEYFRRILCGKLSSWALEGGYPIEFEDLAQIVCDICYNNAKKFFGFQLN